MPPPLPVRFSTTSLGCPGKREGGDAEMFKNSTMDSLASPCCLLCTILVGKRFSGRYHETKRRSLRVVAPIWLEVAETPYSLVQKSKVSTAHGKSDQDRQKRTIESGILPSSCISPNLWCLRRENLCRGRQYSLLRGPYITAHSRLPHLHKDTGKQKERNRETKKDEEKRQKRKINRKVDEKERGEYQGD